VQFHGHTREAYGRDLADFARWCAALGLGLLDVTRSHAELYSRDLAERRGLSPATVARRLAAMASFFDRMLDEDLIARNPIARVRRPRVSRESPRLGLERDELVQLLHTAQRHSVRAHALICLLGLNGLRVSEATGADITDVDREYGHRVLRVLGKGGKVALVPLAERTAAAIDSLVNSYPDRAGPLFRTSRGRMSRHGAFALVRTLARQAGITKTISPHSLRHTFCTQALDAGIALVDVQAAMRHANPATTLHYDRARRGLRNAATYRLSSWLEESRPPDGG
jgi:integrase/recombinase XerD